MGFEESLVTTQSAKVNSKHINTSPTYTKTVEVKSIQVFMPEEIITFGEFNV